MPKTLVIALALLSPALPSLAQNHDHHAAQAVTTPATAATPASGLPMVDAEVRRVDVGAAR